nr:TMV resistance protein N-like [Quercus suber]
MACTKIASSSFLPPSSSSPPGWTYDVFLSFRGNDTRKKFTDHLYAALKQKGISTFRDDEKLKRGELIAPGLFTAIKESRFAVVILSRDYAWSSWCLRELAEIVECMKTGLMLLPVFHYVDPSDVRNLRGTFADAFVKHEENFRDNIEEVQKWKDALTQVANLAGWDLEDRYESKVIKMIVTEILRELSSTCSSVHKDLVGMNSRLAEMENFYLGMGRKDVCFIGIWGMGGIGKTTLARVIYDKFRHDFIGSSFIGDVRRQSQSGGLVNLQKQLLNDILRESNIDIHNIHMGIEVIRNRFRHKRILLVLDDVNQLGQLEALAGATDWFGRGSRIIITTRDKRLLIQHDVATTKTYEIEGLNNDEALQLFCRKAFKQDYPLEGYEELSKKVINYANGLPLALEVLGSFLLRRSVDEWESALGSLEKTPLKEVLDILQISCNGLDENKQDIFLDIACFFRGYDKDYVRDMLQNGQYKEHIGMNILVERSLVTISEGKLGMHDLLEEMGRRIVFLESPKELGERSRLLDEDAVSVLTNNMGSGRIQGIVMHIPPKTVKHLDADVFSRMKNLKYLKIKNVTLQGLNYLPNGLRLLDWPEYPLEALPSSFQPEKLVELIMPRSRLKYLCKGFKRLEYLKRIDLSDSKNLIMTPDFTGIPNLEKLLLKGCARLSMIHTSLGGLKRLILLDLNGCTRLESLPRRISLVSLKRLILSGCSKLEKFPEIEGNMPHLSHLDLEGTAIVELPLSIEHLTGLIELNLKGSAIREWSFFTIVLKKLERLSLCGCERLSFKPSNGFFRCPLPSLTTLNLSYCNLQVIPNEFGGLSSLYELNLSGNNFVYLPESINQLFNLQVINIENCPYLRSLPELPTNITTIRAHGCISLETLPNGFKINDSLYSYFYFLNCFKLVDNQGCGGIFFSLLRSYFQMDMILLFLEVKFPNGLAIKVRGHQ